MISLPVLKLPKVYIQIAKEDAGKYHWILSPHSTTESLLEFPTCKATSGTTWAVRSCFSHPNKQEKRWKLPHAVFLDLFPFTVSTNEVF